MDLVLIRDSRTKLMAKRDLKLLHLVNWVLVFNWRDFPLRMAYILKMELQLELVLYHFMFLLTTILLVLLAHCLSKTVKYLSSSKLLVKNLRHVCLPSQAHRALFDQASISAILTRVQTSHPQLFIQPLKFLSHISSFPSKFLALLDIPASFIVQPLNEYPWIQMLCQNVHHASQYSNLMVLTILDQEEH